MKKYYLFIVALFYSSGLSAQELYLISTDYVLYSVNIDDCTIDLITEVNYNQVYDIAFHPDGTLYGIARNGDLFEIDTLTGEINLIHVFPDNPTRYNSLAISADGLIYTIVEDGAFYSFDITTGIETFHGDVGFSSSGDITFFEGELYLGDNMQRIILVDLEFPMNSTILVDDLVNGNIFGLTSDNENCNETTYLIATYNGLNSSTLYQFDWDTNTANFLCDFNLGFFGSASPTENFSSTAPLSIEGVTLLESNCDFENGSVSFTAEGGNGELLYSIDGVNFIMNSLFENLPAGIHTITIQDELGCLFMQEVELESVDGPTFDNITFDNTNCANNNGTINVFANGGGGNLSYSIDELTFQPSSIFENLSPGTYLVSVVDENDCSISQEVVIGESTGPVIENIIFENITCVDNNAAITIFANGGFGDLNYSIGTSPFQSSNIFENLSPGTYLASVQDENNCINSEEIEIESSIGPELNEVVFEDTSCALNNGSIMASAIGGIGPFEYSIDQLNFQSSNIFENLGPDNYTLTVIDVNGCISMMEVDIAGSAEWSIDRIETVPSYCGGNSGEVTIYINGDSDAIQLFLNEVNYTPWNTIDELALGEYSVLLLDEYNCQVDTSFVIINDECPIYIPNTFSPDGDGQNDFLGIYPHPFFGGTFLSFSIYDRWGELIFELENFESEDLNWNGTFKGEYLNAGVYVYSLKYQGADGKIEFLKGDITLL